MDENKLVHLYIRLDRNFEQIRATLGEMPGSREKSLAATKIDEAQMWAEQVRAKANVTVPMGAPDDPRVRNSG